MSGTTLRQVLAARRGVRVGHITSSFEFAPGWLFYLPVALQWFVLGLRYGSFSLPTAANPAIVTGGLCGESKSAILELAGAAARPWIAPYVTLAAGAREPAAALRAIEAAGIAWPVVVKPDLGCNGTGVRLAADAAALAAMLPLYPAEAALVVQELVPDEGEAGVFYMRRPGEARGRITSITLKLAPHVTGDGRSTLRELVLADERAGRVPHLYLPRLAARLGEVPPAGARVRLVFSGNHCKGSIFRNGTAEVTPAMTARFDAIARDIRQFHFGRFDVRFASLAELRRGEGFRIIEVNGVGSEATHIWDPDTTLREAYAAQFFHYGAAFRIGSDMRRLGHRPSSLVEMRRLWRQQKRLMAAYPMND
ncbi:MAG TPA: D-alanine--D-alanine ligase [Acetobacteraceae bacterium]|nr:D-alanine--D-alanine ligase [Acetobacteraceae bacterium]